MEMYYCDECEKEVDTQIKERKNREFRVKDRTIIVDIKERCCLLCDNAVYDESTDDETLKKIWDIANANSQ